MSVKTVAEKLRIQPGTAIWISHPPQASLLEPLPESVQTVHQMADASIAVVFAHSAADLRDLLASNQDDLQKPEITWVVYPKGNKADINRDSVWPMLAEYSLRPVSQVAVDDVWSALRFRPLKEGEAQFTGGKKNGSGTK